MALQGKEELSRWAKWIEIQTWKQFQVIEDRRHFEVGLDATYFKDEDITVKVIDNQMEIMLEHEQRTNRWSR
ncbi:unnamed protein product, partial [Mesorhabditis belari]|uniref:SHSP domain-containing protein n=1 Tax=Mesorhabditis belari TaxID=2138241 RepID=A0AAF3F6C2_9BILA